MTSDQMRALSTRQIAALSTSAIVALTTDQVTALTPNQVCSLSTTQHAALTTDQITHLSVGSPIILDLNGNGVLSQSIDSGVRFDLFANGQQTPTGWADPGDGFLVLDRNHDGKINDGSELFGDATLRTNGQKATDGYAALADLDSNRDGQISLGDINFADLKIWTDSNSNGVSDPDELHALSDYAITSLNLATTSTTNLENGNVVGLVSNYQTDDRQTHGMADVWFQADRNKAVLAATAPQAMLSIEPTPMQMGVAGLVDAMASYGHHRADRKLDFYADEVDDATLRTAAPVNRSSTTNQLVQVLSQFDANGNQIMGQNSRQNAVASLTATDPSQPPDNTAGLLTIGKG